jgi:hypothetical protein
MEDVSLSRVLDLLARIRNEIATIEAEMTGWPERLKVLNRKLELWTEVHRVLSEDDEVEATPRPPARG